MKKYFYLIVCLMIINNFILAQVTEAEKSLREIKIDTTLGWKNGGFVAINLAQTALKNWSSGGQNSIAINGLLSIYANLKAENAIWDNSLDIGYGVLNQGESSLYVKTDDKFDFLSKYGRKAFENFYYSALINFKTQMTIGRDYSKNNKKISNIFAPAYILGAIGMDYKPSKYFSFFISPVTAKITVVNDQELADAGAFGVDPAKYDSFGGVISRGKKSKSNVGGYIRAIFKKDDFDWAVLKNIAFTSKIDLFSNYMNQPQNIDVSWETQLILKVNEYISVNISTHVLYDNDIAIGIDKNNDGIIDFYGPRTQFKEILGVGFMYKF